MVSEVSDLSAIEALLKPLVESVEQKGAGKARFIFFRHGKRSAEASLDEDGGIWVEYWECEPELLEPPVWEGTFYSIETAREAILSWLLSGNLGPICGL